MKLTIASGDEHDFFRRGQELDSELDRGEPIPEEQLLTFEDRADILELVTSMSRARSPTWPVASTGTVAR